MNLTLDDVQRAVGTTATGGDIADVFAGVSTDTRTLKADELFVALVNEANDGHCFIAQALERGASALVVSRDVDANISVPVFRVPDTEVAYGQIAHVWREKFALPLIGITGSVGKTTTKEMLAAVLTPLGPILKTAASQNNETGVPKTLLQLSETHRAAVIEMGMRGTGQIASLAEIARLTVGVITVIGENHIELLGSREAIADAKGEILEALPSDGVAVLSVDEPFFDRLRAKTAARIVTYSISDPTANFFAEDIRADEDGWRFTVQGVDVRIESASRHDVGNALAALAVAKTVGVALADAARALKEYQPPPMRMEIIRTPGGITVLNDAYNAAPASVRSALATLAAQETGRKIAFLGDMKELGVHSVAAHQELGAAIDSLGGLDALFTVGELAALIPGATDRFADSDTAAQAASVMEWMPGDVILVKGSRAMAMERIATALLERGRDGH